MSVRGVMRTDGRDDDKERGEGEARQNIARSWLK